LTTKVNVLNGGASVRGYFAVGVEGISKSMNVGSLLRSAHAFGASFMFTVAAVYDREEGDLADTSHAQGHTPLYSFDSVDDMVLPRGCQLVGVEITDDAIALPSFRHPQQAAYVFGPERGSLSTAMVDRCKHVVQIPARFSFNVGIAGALVMYDRLINLGRFAPRAERPGGPVVELPPHVHGGPVFRKRTPTGNSGQ
jgi:tRNA G18 (ribose-2'-O)-methylase SpoU